MSETLILVADTKQEHRDQVATALARAGLAERVIPSDSGRRLITDYTRALQRGEQVLAVILDVNLSVLGGKTCSIAIRCIEQAYDHPPVPIIYLSAKEADANLKRVMAYVKTTGFVQSGPTAADGTAIVEALRGMLS